MIISSTSVDQNQDVRWSRNEELTTRLPFKIMDELVSGLKKLLKCSWQNLLLIRKSLGLVVAVAFHNVQPS